MASRKRTPAKAGKRAVALGKTRPNGKSLNGKHVKYANGKSNGTAGSLAAQVPKARKDQLKSKTPPAKRGDTVKSQIVLPVGYRPTDDEPFMNARQRIYFRKKLLTWREEIIRQTRETLQGLHEDSSQHADIADRATFETDRALELRARDRQRKLISKIDSAIARIDDGSYGYCEDTGEPISLKRLDARPIATLSLEAQERHERRERVFRED